MKLTANVLAIILLVTSATSAGQRTASRTQTGARGLSSEKERWSNMKQRFAKYSDFLSGNTWALIHNYESKADMERSVALFQKIDVAIAKDDPAAMKAFEGPNGFNAQLVRLLNSKDDTISAFAASLLAVLGDLRYAPQIALLLDRKGDLDGEGSPPVTIRGRAASALGILGAKQYTERLAKMLKSQNDFDRAGATVALGHLKATNYAGEIAALLSRENSARGDDDDSPIEALIEMGIAGNYRNEIASVVGDQFSSDRSTAAVYALAHLRAREFAKNIAALLSFKYRKGEAAKALALMGAEAYAGEIALLLKDESGLVRKDAALSLGILHARQFAPHIANLLNDPEEYVRYDAAVALVLMDANDFAGKVVPLIEKTHQSGVSFNVGDLHHLVREEFLVLDQDFRAKLAQMKAGKGVTANRLELPAAPEAYFPRLVPALAHQW